MDTNNYILEVEEELWEDYKDTVPRSKNLDEPIIDFIEERVEEYR